MGHQPFQSAGKLQLLDLGPLKERIGDKWPLLSGHLAKFFESTILHHIAPGDTFVRVDELSYLLIFRNLPAQEAEQRCAAVAQEICSGIFGEHDLDASLRNLVSSVNLSAPPAGMKRIRAVDAALELSGKEIIFRTPARGLSSAQSLVSKRSIAAPAQLNFRYRPIWDAAKQVVITYLCQPSSLPEDFLVDPETTEFAAGGASDVLVLRECVEHCRRLRADGLRILTVIPIDFFTLARSSRWHVYAQHLRDIPPDLLRDLGWVVYGIDSGVPQLRLAQELGRLAATTKRFFCLTKEGENTGNRFAETGASALGLAINKWDPEKRSIDRLRQLGRQIHKTGMDGFVLGISSTSLALNALNAGIRYLEGSAIRPFSDQARHGFAQRLEHLYLRQSTSLGV